MCNVKSCEGFHNSLQYQWVWFAIECYKRFVPLILHQLIIGWIGKAHSPTKITTRHFFIDNFFLFSFFFVFYFEYYSEIYYIVFDTFCFSVTFIILTNICVDKYQHVFIRLISHITLFIHLCLGMLDG